MSFVIFIALVKFPYVAVAPDDAPFSNVWEHLLLHTTATCHLLEPMKAL